MPRVKCFRKDCHGEQASGTTYRGLCLKCYSAAKKAVESGQTTWEKLGDLGMCQPTVDNTSFEAELARKLAEQKPE